MYLFVDFVVVFLIYYVVNLLSTVNSLSVVLANFLISKIKYSSVAYIKLKRFIILSIMVWIFVFIETLFLKHLSISRIKF